MVDEARLVRPYPGVEDLVLVVPDRVEAVGPRVLLGATGKVGLERDDLAPVVEYKLPGGDAFLSKEAVTLVARLLSDGTYGGRLTHWTLTSNLGAAAMLSATVSSNTRLLLEAGMRVRSP